jgi:hypothetical protein
MKELLGQIKSVETMVTSLDGVKKSAINLLISMNVEPTVYEYAFEEAKNPKITKVNNRRKILRTKPTNKGLTEQCLKSTDTIN